MKTQLMTLLFSLVVGGALAEARDLESLAPGAQVTSKDDRRSYEVLETTRTGVWVRVPGTPGISGVLSGRGAGPDRRVFIPRARLEGVAPFGPLPLGRDDPAGLVQVLRDDLATLQGALREGRSADLLLPAIRRRAELEGLRRSTSDPRLRKYLGDRVRNFDSARRHLRAASQAELWERAQGPGQAPAEVYVRLEQLLQEAREDTTQDLRPEIKAWETLQDSVGEGIAARALNGQLDLDGAIGALGPSPGLSGLRQGLRQARLEAEIERDEREENARAFLRADERRDAEGRRRRDLPPLERLELDFYSRLSSEPDVLEASVLEIRAQLHASGAADTSPEAIRSKELLRVAQMHLRGLDATRLSSDPLQLSKSLYARGEAYERALRSSGAAGREYREALRRIGEVLAEARAKRTNPPRPIASAAALNERIKAAQAAGLEGLSKQLAAERSLALASGSVVPEPRSSRPKPPALPFPPLDRILRDRLRRAFR